MEELFEEEGKAYLREEEKLKEELDEKKERMAVLKQEIESQVPLLMDLKQKITELDREKAITKELRAIIEENKESEKERKMELLKCKEEGRRALVEKEKELEQAKIECREVKEELHIFVKEREKEKLEFKGMVEALNRRFQ